MRVVRVMRIRCYATRGNVVLEVGKTRHERKCESYPVSFLSAFLKANTHAVLDRLITNTDEKAHIVVQLAKSSDAWGLKSVKHEISERIQDSGNCRTLSTVVVNERERE